MSKRGAARHRAERYRQERAEREGDERLAAMQPRQSDAMQEIIERKVGVDESRQPRFTEPQGIFSSVYRWALTAMANEPGSHAPSRTWDAWYRAYATKEPFLFSVLNGATQIDQNRGWTMTGGRNQVARYTSILKGLPWREYVSWLAQSYYTTQMGFVSEVGRRGRGGPMVNMWTVDPCRCEMTGKPDTPLRYYPRIGGQQDWQPDWFFRAASLINTDEAALGLGSPAVKRCYELAKIMVGVFSHYQQKVGMKTPDAFMTGANISEEQFRVAMQARDEALAANPNNYLNSIATLMSSGPDKPMLELLMLSNLPDRFDPEVWTLILMRGYALAFGYGAGEFYPESYGVIGRGKEQETQHESSTGKGGKDFILQLQLRLQQPDVLPATLEFQFDERDDEGEIKAAQVRLAKAQVITEMTKWAALTPDEIKEIAAEEELIPEEWTTTPDEATATDEEDAETAEQAAGMSERIHRAMRAFPNEPIVRYRWPQDKTTVLRTVRRSVHFVPKVITRSVESVAAGYREQLQAITDDALAGGDPDEIAARHRELILATALLAFVAGMQSGGVSGDEMTAAEKAIVAGWTAEQLAHVDQYAADAVAAGQDPEQRDKILSRLELWVAAILALGGQGLMSANGDRMGTWRLGATERHCRTCAGLHGKRHRLSWYKSRGLIPREPGSTSLECRGFMCDCGIYDDSGKQLL